MTLRPQPLWPVPAAPATAVQAALPKGNLRAGLRAEAGILSGDQPLADPVPLRASRGSCAPGLSMGNGDAVHGRLTGRQAAGAVHRCVGMIQDFQIRREIPGRAAV